MSRHDYFVALELSRNPKITFTSLIMAALVKSPREQYPVLRNSFRMITHEYWDRHHGVRGYLRGENPEADAEYVVIDEEAETINLRRPRTK